MFGIEARLSQKPANAFVTRDTRTAHQFGQHFANTLGRFQPTAS